MSNEIGVIMHAGIFDCQYSITSELDGTCVEIDLESYGKFETDEMRIGDNIPITVAETVIDELGHEIVGFVVPDHQLGMFTTEFPDKAVYRRRSE